MTELVVGFGVGKRDLSKALNDLKVLSWRTTRSTFNLPRARTFALEVPAHGRELDWYSQ